ncbi:PKD domain-containing protein [Streptomyces sp. NPDC051987]|uniref:PKD domain-containing protein n=1 Tax=Streptomyces sp. NPDC051987 TaxID=3155808 RepID=UPI0034402E63
MPRRRPFIASAALAVLLGGLGISPAHADTSTALYVDDASAVCSDTGPGSQAEPFCQIQPAADAAVPGDVVHVAANTTHYAPVTIASAGSSDAPITFVASAGNGSSGIVGGAGTDAITLSGARYVSIVGLDAYASRAAAVVMTNSQHISYTRAAVRSTATTAAIAVDGTSSDISLTRLTVPFASGWGFASAAGAQRITLADDIFSDEVGGGVSAAGTTGIALAGDTVSTVCGDAVSLTDGSSGSVENTVAYVQGTTRCSDSGTPAEITVDAASAAQVTADYNAVNPLSTGTDYDWAGTAYGTSQAFGTGTGQGAHDVDQTDLTLTWVVPEHSPLIDSANADAPGELSADFNGAARVDDPLVADTGSGAGHYDRGATEFQDPLAVTGVTPARDIYVGVPVTFTAVVSNPWSDSLDLGYTFDFGDGSTATSTTGSVTHTYTQETGSADDTLRVVVDRADGTKLGAADASFPILPVPALTGGIACGTNPSAPDRTSCTFDTSYFVPYPVTSDRITFGDGSSAVSVTGSSGTVKHTYAAAGTYTVTQKVTDSGGRTATATARTTVGTAYVAGGPWRVLDTRNGTGAAQRKVGPGGVVRLKILGVDSIPSTGVTAVTMNVTDAGATAASVVTVYPDGTSRPTASDLNFLAGQVNPNLVTVRVGKDGYVDLYNAHGYVNLIADVEGYSTTTPSTTDERMSSLATITPTRVLDTRNGTGAAKGKVGPGSITTVTLPKYARGFATIGAVLDVTVTGGTSSGVVTVFCGSTRPPSTSNLNYRAGQTVSNLVVPTVCTGGKVKIYNSAGYVNLIADLQGLYSNEFAGDSAAGDGTSLSGAPFVPTAPTRFLDTRHGTGAPVKRLAANSTLAVKVAGVDGVPVGADAVLVNLTGTGPTTGTHLTAYGAGSLPDVSDLNLTTGETRPVLTLVPLDSGGYLHIHNANGSVDVIADLEGYFG